MKTIKVSTNLLVTLDLDGDIGLRTGGTQKFLADEVHSPQETVQIGCRFYLT